MKNLSEVLRRPLVTEKSALLKETQRTICFEVHRDASKAEIKKAVETFFGSKVADVRVSNVHGKVKRQGRYVGETEPTQENHERLVAMIVGTSEDRRAENGGGPGGEQAAARS